MDTERLWPPCPLPLGREGPGVPSADGDQGIEPDLAREAADGTLSDKVERWPREAAGGTRPALFFPRLWAPWTPPGARGEGCRGRPSALECLEPAFGNDASLGGRDDEEEVGGGRATFLNVIVHLISSPAKTTCSFHRTKTRTLVLVPLLPPLGGLLTDPSGNMVVGF